MQKRSTAASPTCLSPDTDDSCKVAAAPIWQGCQTDLTTDQVYVRQRVPKQWPAILARHALRHISNRTMPRLT